MVDLGGARRSQHAADLADQLFAAHRFIVEGGDIGHVDIGAVGTQVFGDLVPVIDHAEKLAGARQAMHQHDRVLGCRIGAGGLRRCDGTQGEGGGGQDGGCSVRAQEAAH